MFLWRPWKISSSTPLYEKKKYINSPISDTHPPNNTLCTIVFLYFILFSFRTLQIWYDTDEIHVQGATILHNVNVLGNPGKDDA